MLLGGWFWLGVFLTNSGHIFGRWAILWCRNLLLSPTNLTQGNLLKIEWLITNVTAVECPDRAERAILGLIFVRFFLPIQALLLVREQLYRVGTPSWTLIPFYLGLFNGSRVVYNRCNSCLTPWQSQTCYFGGDFGKEIILPVQDMFVVSSHLVM